MTAASGNIPAAVTVARSSPTAGSEGVPWPTRASRTIGPTPSSSASWLSVRASVTGTKARPAYCSRTWAGVRYSRRNGPYWVWVRDSTVQPPSVSVRTTASGSPSGSTSSTAPAASNSGGSSRVTRLPGSLKRVSGARAPIVSSSRSSSSRGVG